MIVQGFLGLGEVMLELSSGFSVFVEISGPRTHCPLMQSQSLPESRIGQKFRASVSLPGARYVSCFLALNDTKFLFYTRLDFLNLSK